MFLRACGPRWAVTTRTRSGKNIQRVAKAGHRPELATPVDGSLYFDMVAHLSDRLLLFYKGRRYPDYSDWMFVAAVTVLMAGSCRFMDVWRAKFEFVYDYADPQVRAAAGGAVSGIDIRFPDYVPHEELGVVRNSRKHNTSDMTVRIPETFENGFSPAELLRQYFVVAPKTGFLFRWASGNDTRVPHWGPEDAQVSNASFNNKLRDTIRAVQPEWGAELVNSYASHSFRGGAATNISAAGLEDSTLTRTMTHAVVNGGP